MCRADPSPIIERVEPRYVGSLFASNLRGLEHRLGVARGTPSKACMGLEASSTGPCVSARPRLSGSELANTLDALGLSHTQIRGASRCWAHARLQVVPASLPIVISKPCQSSSLVFLPAAPYPLLAARRLIASLDKPTGVCGSVAKRWTRLRRGANRGLLRMYRWRGRTGSWFSATGWFTQFSAPHLSTGKGAVQSASKS